MDGWMRWVDEMDGWMRWIGVWTKIYKFGGFSKICWAVIYRRYMDIWIDRWIDIIYRMVIDITLSRGDDSKEVRYKISSCLGLLLLCDIIIIVIIIIIIIISLDLYDL